MAGPRKASFPRQGLRGERGVSAGLNVGGQAERGEHQRKLVSLLLSLDGGAAGKVVQRGEQGPRGRNRRPVCGFFKRGAYGSERELCDFRAREFGAFRGVAIRCKTISTCSCSSNAYVLFAAASSCSSNAPCQGTLHSPLDALREALLARLDVLVQLVQLVQLERLRALRRRGRD